MAEIAPVRARTGLSPEWDRGFDEAFTDLVCGDDDLVRAEFDALIRSSWRPPVPPAPPAPAAVDPPDPDGPGPVERRSGEQGDDDTANERPP